MLAREQGADRAGSGAEARSARRAAARPGRLPHVLRLLRDHEQIPVEELRDHQQEAWNAGRLETAQ